MCGIAGVISKDPKQISIQKLKAMTDVISHRGPDGEGHWISSEGNVGLGHRRLSIIDLSHEADQPMHYLGRYSIIFNGEIYNYIEIKETLIKQGYQFRTQSDTEVLMALYDKEGVNCLQQLDGMFAFVIYDSQEQKVFCARDRFGEKPFHYSYQPGQYFIFGSEMKSLWKGGVKKNIHNPTLYNYIQFGALYNPDNQAQTFYEDIYRLEQSHYILIDVKTLDLKKQRYWDIDLSVRTQISEKNAIEKFNELFFTSVSRRLRSDVPVGSSLSGGLDSSAVVCAIDRLNKDKMIHQKTFSAQFPGFAKDEAFYQNLVIEQTKADGYFTYPDAEKMLQELDRVFYHQEEPFGSSSIMAQFEVYKLAKEKDVTVLLDGQGADEVLAGYYGYFVPFFNEIRGNRTLFKEQFNAYQNLHKTNTINVLHKNDLKSQVRNAMPGFYEVLGRWKSRLKANGTVINKDFFEANKRQSVIPSPSFKNLNKSLYHSLLNGSLQELLRYADRNSMAHSLEVRLPFLNHQFVEFVYSLPIQYKINEGWTKYIMRKAFEPILPSEITWRIDKIGYEPPQKKWMEQQEIQDNIREAKKVLVEQNILESSVLNQPIKAADAADGQDQDWKYYMAAKIFG
ncbi:asparagine synthase (glutamine-hydrolyzing) [Taibaiella lutea]|uniref:asparagine synthase (glutamine-hydrolyzing) n=1 Tax=Taibaiella lutea TaxID=2608001 RepID=A0A5M6CIJ0_9BACT|nr:asparagine synthase (glutamine-hydrolyzing) [Taibaiella lutea]KAA5533772.1 asparagine synthase (glutamine-hydrolyzing) [Taibaiella lutea]